MLDTTVYKYGQIFKLFHRSGSDIYILAALGESMAALINLHWGSKMSKPFLVTGKITGAILKKYAKYFLQYTDSKLILLENVEISFDKVIETNARVTERIGRSVTCL
jgi:hypothetical protein